MITRKFGNFGSFGGERHRQQVRQVTVTLQCTKEAVKLSEVKFLDVSEDIQGQDVISFTCPKCSQQHRSLVRG